MIEAGAIAIFAIHDVLWVIFAPEVIVGIVEPLSLRTSYTTSISEADVYISFIVGEVCALYWYRKFGLHVIAHACFYACLVDTFIRTCCSSIGEVAELGTYEEFALTIAVVESEGNIEVNR